MVRSQNMLIVPGVMEVWEVFWVLLPCSSSCVGLKHLFGRMETSPRFAKNLNSFKKNTWTQVSVQLQMVRASLGHTNKWNNILQRDVRHMTHVSDSWPDLSIGLGVDGENKVSTHVGLESGGDDQILGRLQTVRLNQIPFVGVKLSLLHGPVSLEEGEHHAPLWCLGREEP